MKDSIISYIKEYIKNGLSYIPLKPKSKEPAIPWKIYQQQLPEPDRPLVWFSGRNSNRNVAIVTGSVSGNLVVIDFDKKEKYSEFMEKLPTNLKITLENTWTVKTGKGYHIYLRIDGLDKDEFKEFIRTKVRITEGIDIKAEGGYVVAPPSIHPSGAQYEFIKGPPEYGIMKITPDDFEDIIRIIAPKVEKKETPSRGRNLSKEELEELFNLLKGVYRQGYRRRLFIALCPWFYDANVSKESLKALARMFKELDGDEEVYQKIIGIIDYQYDRRIPELKAKGEKIIKRKRESPTEILGLQDILEEFYDESTAIEIIRRIEEILGKASPWMDSIIEVMHYEKQLYAVANLRKLVVYRAKRVKSDGDANFRLAPMERVFIGAPTRVIVYVNPLGGLTKYEVTWEVSTRPRPYVIGPAPIEDIVGRLKAEGLVVSRRLADDVLSAIIEGFVRKGRAEIKEEIESPGFYFIEGKLVSVRHEVKRPSREELREALMLLDELATKWFSHVVDKFALAIKWGIVSPFIYAMKQKGKWVPWLYLYGASFTGKTTIGEIILDIWGLDSRHRRGGSSIDTIPRLGNILSCSTFPTLVNEPGNALSKEDIIETLKSAIESVLARSKYIRGAYTDIPALSPIIFASNKVIPRDDALLRRLMVLRFTYGEKIDPERAEAFDKEIRPKLTTLRHIGSMVASVVLENPEVIDRFDWEELGKRLLTYCYAEVEMDPPEWISARPEITENIYDDIREAIRAYLVKRINDEYTRFVGRVEVFNESGYVGTVSRSDVSFPDRVRIVIANRLLPWAIPRERNNGLVVYLTSEFARELQPITGDIGGLKSLAELLGWAYNKKSFRDGGKVITKYIIEVSIEEFIRFLTSGEEDDGQGESLPP